MAMQTEMDDLFTKAMKGQWNEVVEMYREIRAQTAKITKSDDTALHIAVSVGETETAVELVNIADKDSLKITNVRGNTALHVAAALGNLEVCESMVEKNSYLMAIRNNDGEIPLFLAALNGKKETFSFLNAQCTGAHHYVRRNNGDTILHVAIAGEYFSLAMNIIEVRPKLVDSMNENGLSPLHILASKPNAFKSSTPLGFFDGIIYKCYVVDDLKEEGHDVEAYVGNIRGAKESQIYPQNYETCKNFLVLLRFFFQVLFVGRKKDGNDEENPQQKDSLVQGSEDYFPPNYNICVYFFKFVMKAMLIILGIGFWKINKIRRKKRLHMWANRVMNKLVELTDSYKSYENTGRDPKKTRNGEVGEEFNVPEISDNKDVSKNPSPSDHNNDKKTEQNESGGRDMKHAKSGTRGSLEIIEKRQTPILIAAKMGITEMVDKILDKFPVAIQDLDDDNKNIVLLAVENRQPQVYELLLNKKILKESVFRQLDSHGNSALHLAAQCKHHQPWLIPGGALQMQWEIKWYKFVKNSMPPHFFPLYNTNQETAKEVFIKSHEKLIENGSKWLSKTSESCSLVAVLVATVAFATSATVPGGLDENTGKPILADKPAFDAFAIASLVALCFSITALVFFLSILTSRCQEKDFAMDLPRKLLLGLTCLFASIASMLISFCDGHAFILRPRLRIIAYPLYVALCFPVTYLALAQLSLYFDLIRAIFRKVPQRCSKVFLK
ncbi:hypothetical protein UlMin_010287 [Ulmus minor]